MPCRDPVDWDEPRVTKRHGLAIEDFEAVLCGILTVLEKEERLFGLDDVDWTEVGVKQKTVETWWKAHKLEDIARRKQEKAEKRMKELRVAALAKLTPEEKAVLGIKA